MFGLQRNTLVNHFFFQRVHVKSELQKFLQIKLFHPIQEFHH